MLKKTTNQPIVPWINKRDQSISANKFSEIVAEKIKSGDLGGVEVTERGMTVTLGEHGAFTAVIEGSMLTSLCLVGTQNQAKWFERTFGLAVVCEDDPDFMYHYLPFDVKQTEPTFTHMHWAGYTGEDGWIYLYNTVIDQVICYTEFNTGSITNNDDFVLAIKSKFYN